MGGCFVALLLQRQTTTKLYETRDGRKYSLNDAVAAARSAWLATDGRTAGEFGTLDAKENNDIRT